MEMKHSLNLTLRPALIMTPRLQQALKLLQVPTLELQQILKQEIMQNPLLEEVDEVTDSEDLAKEDSPEEAANAEAEDPAEDDPVDWSEYMQDGALDRAYVPQSETTPEFFEKVPVTRTTLAESLLEQLHFLELSGEQMDLADFLVGSIDDRGWLATPLDEVAQATGRPLAECEAMLTVIQALEPVGVGARDLRECLLIQLEARRQQDTLPWRLIHDQFDNLVNRRFPEIARQLKCTVEEIQAAADVVATLNPRPGLQVSSEDPKYVVPDLLVERVDDEYVVLLNDRHLPRLRISAAYEGVLRDKKKADCTKGEVKTREYIQGKLNSARWLIQTIEQRRRTMIKVMNCIIREQREFFDKGIAFLRPLTLQQVARQIDMHESTVSRVCSGKYVQTPRGVFELKFFFSSGLETENGEDVSARTAKDIIKTLIEEENKKEPLSDQRIAELLHERGLRIARRTVAKYREQLSILPARFRRRVA
ncbi:MAG: RNA polymerase sigma-54 factor [Candidatus Eisenbacteria bacterium RBG_16_71_46]|nr:MAG: RNA polymerase sigma-54 factor [Candidatus Eisenbacteria bacterium RBG_16_71_46]OGF21804.1 MAG: RNA polymerase sigma-54 factor [Candidatus Eisenbacteria bacterium RBG_19FT_COMBO_70_11]